MDPPVAPPTAQEYLYASGAASPPRDLVDQVKNQYLFPSAGGAPAPTSAPPPPPTLDFLYAQGASRLAQEFAARSVQLGGASAADLASLFYNGVEGTEVLAGGSPRTAHEDQQPHHQHLLSLSGTGPVNVGARSSFPGGAVSTSIFPLEETQICSLLSSDFVFPLPGGVFWFSPGELSGGALRGR